MKTPRGTARRLRRAAMNYQPRPIVQTATGAQLHRLAARLK